MLIDSIGEASGAGMGLMIGIAFGICGLIVAPVAGFFIQTWGWTADYIMLALATLLTFIPLFFTRETVDYRKPMVAQGGAK
jgi:MFS family permease